MELAGTALYPENDSLGNHVSKDTYELVKKELGDAGVPLLLIDKQKPWFPCFDHHVTEIPAAGVDPSYGIDAYFLRKASAQRVSRNSRVLIFK